jgi:hypothetical protein
MTPTLKIVETGALFVIMKDGKPMCSTSSRQDARLIKMACEEWWRVGASKGSVT